MYEYICVTLLFSPQQHYLMSIVLVMSCTVCQYLVLYGCTTYGIHTEMEVVVVAVAQKEESTNDVDKSFHLLSATV